MLSVLFFQSMFSQVSLYVHTNFSARREMVPMDSFCLVDLNMSSSVLPWSSKTITSYSDSVPDQMMSGTPWVTHSWSRTAHSHCKRLWCHEKQLIFTRTVWFLSMRSTTQKIEPVFWISVHHKLKTQTLTFSTGSKAFFEPKSSIYTDNLHENGLVGTRWVKCSIEVLVPGGPWL